MPSKQSLLMQMLTEAFSIFASMYASTFKMLDYNFTYMEEPEFARQLRMLTALAFLLPQDVVRGFVAVCIENRTNFGNVAKELLATFRTPMLADFALMLQEIILCFQKNFGTCSIVLIHL